MSQPDWNIGGNSDHPGQGDQHLGVRDGADGQGRDGEDHSKEPVPGHEDQCVDGDIGANVDDVLDSPAPEESKGPVHEYIVTGGERNAHEDEEEVSNSKVENEQVGCVLHPGVEIDLQEQLLVTSEVLYGLLGVHISVKGLFKY